ncbi:cell division protein FtsX [Cohaesibacter intestini]|uniref:cell division protein FtsX n=1 Tax=Cohaesibacter intestini TaxID=2211145 RepID=UPI000DEAED02|nr:ABC transporter permease [Cohaesibacter intestini]
MATDKPNGNGSNRTGGNGHPSGPSMHGAHSLPPMPSSSPRVGPNLNPIDSQSFAPSGKPPPTIAKPKRRKGRLGGLKPKAMLKNSSFAMANKADPIVPKGTIAGHALVLVIAIMSFLAALTVAGVSVVSDATRDWQSDISRGATIQIRPIEGVDIDAELAKAVRIAREANGINSARVLTERDSNALLEPWLGLDLAFDDLPVPRLIELTIDDPSVVDFAAISDALQKQVRGAILDNHRFWVDRLKSMAETAILAGVAILALVIAATVLIVVFATRAAMAGNKETIEVLHFVGASNRFIASEFQRRFFALGIKGSISGGGGAMLAFLMMQFVVREDEGSAAADQMQALLGVIELGYSAYLGTLALALAIAIFTAVTTRLTVINTLSKLS